MLIGNISTNVKNLDQRPMQSIRSMYGTNENSAYGIAHEVVNKRFFVRLKLNYKTAIAKSRFNIFRTNMAVHNPLTKNNVITLHLYRFHIYSEIYNFYHLYLRVLII